MSKGDRVRLDLALVRRGLARSRGEARELIDANRVRIDGVAATKPATPIDAGTPIAVTRDSPAWVGRGAAKLDAAISVWAPSGLAVADRRCLDVGASTGGFTQVLLHHGAAHVVALDVGRGQLVQQLREDPRVIEHSQTSIRDVTSADLGTFDLIVADLSFISLTTVMGNLVGLAGSDSDIVLLVKPQFEVGKAALNKRGVVGEAGARERALADVIASAQAHGLAIRGLQRSSITGTEGNVEYLMWATTAESGTMGAAQIAAAISEVSEEGHV